MIFKLVLLPLQQSRPSSAQNRGSIIVQIQSGSFAQRQHWMIDEVQQLHDAILSCFALLLTVRIVINVMRIYVDRNDPEGNERWRILNRHIVGCVDGRSGDIRSGTAAHVGQLPRSNTTSDRLNQFLVVQILEKFKRISATDENALGLFDGLNRIGKRVETNEFDACIFLNHIIFIFYKKIFKFRKIYQRS